MRVRRSQDLEVEHAVHGDVDRVAGVAGDDRRSERVGAGSRRRRGRRRPPRRTRRRGWRPRSRGSRCTGTGCPSARGADPPAASSSRLAAVMIMPAVQKPHWNAWASRNACCIGWSSPSLREPLEGRDRAALGPEGGDEAAVDRLAVEPDRARAAVAGVASLLHAEPAEVAQERAQALAGPGLGREQLAVDGEFIGSRSSASSARICSAIVVRQVPAVRGRAVHVVEVDADGDASSSARLSSSADGARSKRSWTGRTVAAVTVSRNSPAFGVACR